MVPLKIDGTRNLSILFKVTNATKRKPKINIRSKLGGVRNFKYMAKSLVFIIGSKWLLSKVGK